MNYFYFLILIIYLKQNILCCGPQLCEIKQKVNSFFTTVVGSCFINCSCQPYSIQISESCIKFDKLTNNRISYCAECADSYYLDKNTNQCLRYEPIINCKAYSQRYENCLKCEEGYFVDSTQRVCNKCLDTNCQQCDVEGLCQKCLDPYYLVPDQKGSCLKDCPNNNYLALTKSKLCVQKEQSFKIEFCESLSYNQKDGAICQKCQDGYTLSINKICQKQCYIDNCQICQSQSSCKLCANGYFLHNVANQLICVKQCPDQYIKGSSECMIKEISSVPSQAIQNAQEQNEKSVYEICTIVLGVFTGLFLFSNIFFIYEWAKNKRKYMIAKRNQIQPDPGYANQHNFNYPQAPPPPPLGVDNIIPQI